MRIVFLKSLYDGFDGRSVTINHNAIFHVMKLIEFATRHSPLLDLEMA